MRSYKAVAIGLTGSLLAIMAGNPQCSTEKQQEKSNPCVRVSQGNGNVHTTPENCRR